MTRYFVSECVGVRNILRVTEKKYIVNAFN